MTAAFLSDGTVDLRPVERGDLVQLASWRNDPELRLRTREFRPLNMANQERWLDHISGPDSTDFMFVVVSDSTLTPTMLGVVGLCRWDARNRHAETSFYNGSNDMRGKGYMRRALTLLHAWGFQELSLERISAECFEFNEPSIALLKKLGFQEESRLRKHVYRMGKRWDSVMLGLLREEWQDG